jgi:hypothetical protein
MPVPQPLQSRLIGALFVERGLVSESQIRVALELQQETGQQLGQIVVERFGVSRKELASVVAEQWAKLGGSAGPEDNASWRRLGEIFVERGFVSQEELERALERQRQTGERLGEALVAQGVISKFELAGALAEQMAALGETTEAEAEADERPHATVHHFPRPEVPVEASVEFAEEPEGEPQPEPAGTLLEAVRDLERDEPSFQPEAEPQPELEPAWGETLLEAVPEPGPEVELAPEPTLEEVHEPALEDVPEPTLEVASEPALEEVHAPTPELPSEPELEEVPEPVLEQVEALFDVESRNRHVVPTEDVGQPIAIDASVDESAERTAVGIFLEEAPKPEPAAACFAFAPTTRGYLLVPLEEIPSAGQMIDLADVGKRVVLRVGGSPIPMDDRVFAFVEEAVTLPLAALPEEQSPRRFAASLAGRPHPTLSL